MPLSANRSPELMRRTEVSFWCEAHVQPHHCAEAEQKYTAESDTVALRRTMDPVRIFILVSLKRLLNSVTMTRLLP